MMLFKLMDGIDDGRYEMIGHYVERLVMFRVVGGCPQLQPSQIVFDIASCYRCA